MFLRCLLYQQQRWISSTSNIESVVIYYFYLSRGNILFPRLIQLHFYQNELLAQGQTNGDNAQIFPSSPGIDFVTPLDYDLYAT